MEETFKKLSELIGKGGKVKESEKSIKRKKEKFFLDIISILCEIEAYQKISESVGISLVKYEDLHFQIIEGLLEKQYGELEKNIIIWWVFESLKENGEVYPLVSEDGVRHTMENRICIKCRETINPLRIKALPTAKTCVECSTTGAKRGVPMMFGEKDHTWTDIVLMEPEQYDVYEKHQQNYFKDSKVEMLDFEKEDAKNEEDIDFDNIM